VPRRTPVIILLALSLATVLILPAVAGNSRARTGTQRLVMRDGEVVEVDDRDEGEDDSASPEPDAAVSSGPAPEPTATSAPAPGLTTPTPGVTTPTPDATSAATTASSSTPLTPLSTSGLNRYWIGGGQAPSGIPSLAFVVQKGAKVVPSGVRAINYEQSFALNDTEAAYARSRGWLAKTCGGSEIHPANIRGVTLLDVTNAAALEWRAATIAGETNGKGYDGTYLDTLRAYHPDGFYDGTPCGITDAKWLTASVNLVTLVKARTGGKLVIANGAGMGSGRKYFATNRAADPIIAAADAVQIEHFARRADSSADVAFIDAVTGQGKLAFAKCDNQPDACTSLFSRAQRPEMRFLHIG
jgi:hypothetical protein